MEPATRRTVPAPWRAAPVRTKPTVARKPWQPLVTYTIPAATVPSGTAQPGTKPQTAPDPLRPVVVQRHGTTSVVYESGPDKPSVPAGGGVVAPGPGKPTVPRNGGAPGWEPAPSTRPTVPIAGRLPVVATTWDPWQDYRTRTYWDDWGSVGSYSDWWYGGYGVGYGGGYYGGGYYGGGYYGGGYYAPDHYAHGYSCTSIGSHASYRVLGCSPYRRDHYYSYPWYSTYYYDDSVYWSSGAFYAPGFAWGFYFGGDGLTEGILSFAFGYGGGIRIAESPYLYSWYPCGGYQRLSVYDQTPEYYTRYVAPRVSYHTR